MLALMEAIHEVRLKVWAQQPEAFFEEAVLDADGTIAATTGQCKQGMERTYDGQWGFHPLVLSLSNTHEPLYLVNRAGNRPSHEDAYLYYDRAIAFCRRAGFRRITLRGDTDFSQTKQLDRGDKDTVEFIFGYDAQPNLVALAERLLRRPAEQGASFSEPGGWIGRGGYREAGSQSGARAAGGTDERDWDGGSGGRPRSCLRKQKNLVLPQEALASMR